MERKLICLGVSILSLALIAWACWDWEYLNGPVAELIGGFIGLHIASPLTALATAVAAMLRKDRAWPFALLSVLAAIGYFVFLAKALLGLPIPGHP